MHACTVLPVAVTKKICNQKHPILYAFLLLKEVPVEQNNLHAKALRFTKY
jgi:hypothetical protein